MLYCPCAKTSADGQPDTQQTNRRINRHKTTADTSLRSASFAGAEEIDDSAGRGESVALGWREADVECGFELIAKFDQVKRVASEVVDKGGVEGHLRRREVEVPCDDGLDACLYGSLHLPRILPRTC